MTIIKEIYDFIVRDVYRFIVVSLRMPGYYYAAAVVAALIAGLITRKWRWAFLTGYMVILFSSMVLNRDPYRTAKIIVNPTMLQKDLPKLTGEKVTNIIAFIPIGFFAGKKWWGLFIGVGFSVLIEILQYKLRLGYFETDDLILNTLGTLISLLPTQLFFLVFGRHRKKDVWNYRFDYV